MKKRFLYSMMVAMTALFAMASCCSSDSEKKLTDETKARIVVENIASRKSVRKFTDRAVEEEKIISMLKAGMAAPSGRDKRPWEFVVIQERPLLDAMAAALPYAKMLRQCSLAIVVCGDTTLSSCWYLDCSAATQNILLTAEALGLGAVWTAAYPYEDRMNAVREHTRLPSHVIPLCVIPVGYPDGTVSPKDKFDESRIHRNRFE